MRPIALTRSGVALMVLLGNIPAVAAPLKVACTGTSAMQGLGSSAGHHVPDELGIALGPGFEVGNFGAEGTTAIASIPSSYAATTQMKAALAFNPDVVLFWFGGNDSFQGTWDAHKSEFKADYTSLVRTFQALPTHPKTFLVRLWAFVDMPVQRSVLDQEILPLIDQIAADTGSVLIDYRKEFENHPEYFPDGMHPNDAGTVQIGKFFADSVTSALATAIGSGGMTSLGGAAGAGAGGAGGMAMSSGGTAGVVSAVGGGSAGSAVNAAGANALGGTSAGESSTTSGAASLPAAGTPSAAVTSASDTGSCNVGVARQRNASSALCLLFAGICAARRRRPSRLAPRS